MKVSILAFGIAKDIVGGNEFRFDLKEKSDVGMLKHALFESFPDFSKLTSVAIAVNGEYAKDGFLIEENDEIVIIPPVSGG